jgi:hypothetical protein
MSISSTLSGHLSSHGMPPSKVSVSHTRKRDEAAASHHGASQQTSGPARLPRVRSRDSSPRKVKSNEDPMASGFAFAVVGHDSDTSAVSSRHVWPFVARS